MRQAEVQGQTSHCRAAWALGARAVCMPGTRVGCPGPRAGHVLVTQDGVLARGKTSSSGACVATWTESAPGRGLVLQQSGLGCSADVRAWEHF